MLAKIIKIDPLKASRNNGQAFRRVYFRIKEKVDSEKSIWGKTDLVPTFRNYARWKDLLVVGNILGGIRLKKKDEVDADSPVFFAAHSHLGPKDVGLK